MKILYDHQMFSMQKYGGVTKYFCELIKNLPEGFEFKLSLLFSDNEHLRENHPLFKSRNILPERGFRWRDVVERKIYKLNEFYSIKTIEGGKYDLFHPTYYNPYFLKALKKPYILTVHDLIYFKFEGDFFLDSPTKAYMEASIRNAHRIIAISENTKKDLVEILRVNPDKIDVVYHGYNKPDFSKEPLIPGRYLLFVGRRGLYKNFKRFAAAIAGILTKERDIQLICVGPPFKEDESRELSQLGIFEQTKAMSVNDASLNSLYANALVFVFPSLYEGFGMPILEAFANDCPVCLSNSSCFPEIAGKAGEYFDPYQEDSIRNAIEKVIYNETLAEEMKEKGREILKSFSWKKTAMETAIAYKKVLE